VENLPVGRPGKGDQSMPSPVRKQETDPASIESLKCGERGKISGRKEMAPAKCGKKTPGVRLFWAYNGGTGKPSMVPILSKCN